MMEKDTIPKGTQRTVKKLNICDTRIKRLINGERINDASTSSATIHPKMCGVNLGPNNSAKSLTDEPGIKELMELYFDSYDYSSGVFTLLNDGTPVNITSSFMPPCYVNIDSYDYELDTYILGGNLCRY